MQWCGGLRASYEAARCGVAQVVDVPGDHFSLLRQDAADMTVLVAALKATLAPHGWVEMIQPARKPYTMTKVSMEGCKDGASSQL